MKNAVKVVSVFALFLVISFLAIVSVSALSTRAGLAHGDSITLEEQDISSPTTKISTEATTSSADITTKLQRKGLLFYSTAGTVTFNVVANRIYTTTWDVSGTKDTKATWTNSETDVGYIVIGTFTLI